MTNETLLIAATAVLLVAAGIQDMRSYRIANAFPAFIIALFGASLLLTGVPEGLWSHGVHFLIALVAGMGLFALRWFGAGDAKLYAAIALWFPLSVAPILLVAVAMAGLVEAVLYIAGRRVLAIAGRNIGALKDRHIPYGVAIAAGGILTFVQTGRLPMPFIG